MVLQTYGLSISSDDECVENRLINDNEIISDRKSVNYSDNMLAMSPFAGDYPPTSNYINYTDLDASYATQGKTLSLPMCPFPVRETRMQMMLKCMRLIVFSSPLCSFRWCSAQRTSWVMKFNTNSMSPEVPNFCNFCLFFAPNTNGSSIRWTLAINGKFYAIFLSQIRLVFHQKPISGARALPSTHQNFI